MAYGFIEGQNTQLRTYILTNMSTKIYQNVRQTMFQIDAKMNVRQIMFHVKFLGGHKNLDAKILDRYADANKILDKLCSR